ncbi:hypothetical protein U1Q18_042668 [Sarracenia purpurea var. burkii]
MWRSSLGKVSLHVIHGFAKSARNEDDRAPIGDSCEEQLGRGSGFREDSSTESEGFTPVNGGGGRNKSGLPPTGAFLHNTLDFPEMIFTCFSLSPSLYLLLFSFSNLRRIGPISYRILR